MVKMKSEGTLLETFLLLGEASLFTVSRHSADQTRPTHIMESNLLYTKLTYLLIFLKI